MVALWPPPDDPHPVPCRPHNKSITTAAAAWMSEAHVRRWVVGGRKGKGGGAKSGRGRSARRWRGARGLRMLTSRKKKKKSRSGGAAGSVVVVVVVASWDPTAL